MTAVEAQFPAITDTGSSWLDSATNTFEDLAGRWDTQSCGGGLHWQIAARGGSSAADYKNAISQAVLFQLAARLARYTGNQTYASWASKTWDWTASVGLIAPGSIVYDGTSTSDNCSEITKLQWTYDSGAFLYGSAVMHNIVRLWQCMFAKWQLLIPPSRAIAISNGRTGHKVSSLPCLVISFPVVMKQAPSRQASHLMS